METSNNNIDNDFKGFQRNHGLRTDDDTKFIALRGEINSHVGTITVRKSVQTRLHLSPQAVELYHDARG